MSGSVDLRHRNIGRVAKALRAIRGYNVKEMSSRMGVSESYLSLLERGQRKWTEPLIEKLAGAIGQHPNDLVRMLGASVAKIAVTVHLDAEAP